MRGTLCALVAVPVGVAAFAACASLAPPDVQALQLDAERVACLGKKGAEAIAACTRVLERPEPYLGGGTRSLNVLVFAIRAGVAQQLARLHLAADADEEAFAAARRSLALYERFNSERAKTATSPAQRTAIEKQTADFRIAVAQPNYLAGVALIRLRRWTPATTYLRGAVERDPGHVGAWAALGVAANQTGEHDEARRAFETALKLDPGYFNEATTVQQAIAEASQHGRTYELDGAAAGDAL